MEGFYTVQFEGIQGWGAGVVTLVGGQVFGGDNGYLYTGTYQQSGDTLTASIHVAQFTAGVPSVMGQTSFDMLVNGNMSGDHIAVTGTVAGAPASFRGNLTKRGAIPASR